MIVEHFFFFFFFVSLFNNVVGRPTENEPIFVTIPLTRTPETSSSLYGSIIQQQNINRGLKRFAKMTGRKAPSDFDLLSAIRNRILHLPTAHQKSYKLDKINGALAFLQHRQNRTRSSASSANPLAYRETDSETSNNVSTLHNTGLSIEAQDFGYMAQLQIGSQHKNFSLLVDSGSSDLWIPSENCQGNDGGDCGPHASLGPKSSKSFKQTNKTWSINYVSGSVSGLIVQDDVTIAGLKVKDHKFGMATNESSDFTPADIPFDGLLGTGKQQLSQQNVPTLLQSLFQSKLISAPVISYKLPRLIDFKNDGELTLGAMDPKLYDPKTVVTLNNINQFGYWTVPVGNVSIGGHDMNWTNRTILMDTGTTLMIAPQKDVDAIHARIPGAKRSVDGSWTVPCNMTTIITLTIGTQAFPIDPRDVAFYQTEGGNPNCMSGIAAGGVGPFFLDNEWLAGDVFLKNVYFSTDDSTNQVSIAKPSSV